MTRSRIGSPTGVFPAGIEGRNVTILNYDTDCTLSSGRISGNGTFEGTGLFVGVRSLPPPPLPPVLHARMHFTAQHHMPWLIESFRQNRSSPSRDLSEWMPPLLEGNQIKWAFNVYGCMVDGS